MWADLKFTVTGEITLDAYGTISVTASATASLWFKAGVEWIRGTGWRGIWSVGAGASKTGPTITGTASLSITPSLKNRLAFLFYSVAGPFVEAMPYVPISVTYSPRTWSIRLKFKVIGGVTMAGWLRSLLGLGDWSTTLYDTTLASWSGTW